MSTRTLKRLRKSRKEGIILKNLNVAVTDLSDRQLCEIMLKQRFKNRADAVAWVIEQEHEKLFPNVNLEKV